MSKTVILTYSMDTSTVRDVPGILGKPIVGVPTSQLTD